MQLCHIHFYQKIARKKVARVNAALEGLQSSCFLLLFGLIKIPLYRADIFGIIFSNWLCVFAGNTIFNWHGCLKYIAVSRIRAKQRYS